MTTVHYGEWDEFALESIASKIISDSSLDIEASTQHELVKHMASCHAYMLPNITSSCQRAVRVISSDSFVRGYLTTFIELYAAKHSLIVNKASKIKHSLSKMRNADEQLHEMEVSLSELVSALTIADNNAKQKLMAITNRVSSGPPTLKWPKLVFENRLFAFGLGCDRLFDCFENFCGARWGMGLPSLNTQEFTA